MIVTIDGPAGAGKSSAARALAKRLGYDFLDTGAMYRAVAWAALQRNVALNQADELARLAAGLKLELTGERVLVDGIDVSAAIRSLAVTEATKHAADNPAVRARLVELQRAFAQGRNIVTEGRDQGTVAFPQAECKIYLTASPAERARRRWQELQAHGAAADFESILQSQTERDARDASREVGGMVQAADAIAVSTDGLSADEVVDRLEALVRGEGG